MENYYRERSIETLRILHISPSYKPAFHYGGPTLSVSHLCETLVKQNHTVEVLTTTANGRAELKIPATTPQFIDGVKVCYFRRWTGDHSHFSPTLLFRVWHTCRQYDIVHIHSWWNTVAVLSVLICRMRKVRPVVSPRGMLSPYTMRSPLKRVFHRFTGRFLLRETVLHATSVQEEQEIAGLVPGSAICCLPNLVPLPAAAGGQPMTDTQNKPFHILFLGRIDPKKGLENLFHALTLLPFPFRLTIAGAGEPGYETRLRWLSEDLGISRNVEWTGWAEGTSKYQLLGEADVFVLPSRNENFANAALEALSMGTPVVLSETVGLAAYVLQTGFGRVCPADPGSLAETIGALAAENGSFDRQTIAGRVRRDFDPDQLAKNYVEVYRKMVAHRTANP